MTAPLRPPLTSSLSGGRRPGAAPGSPVALLLAALLCLLAAAPASAAPPQPTMGLAELRATLAPGPLDDLRERRPGDAVRPPLRLAGAGEAALTGGNVDGVWADAMTPYKLISPRDVEGAVVQGRYWGVPAELGREPDFYPMTATVSLVDEGREVSDLTCVSGWFSAQPMFADLPAFIAAQVIVDAADAGAFPGSAESTATARLSDASGEYTVVRENLHDSSWDASWGPADDLAGILLTLADDPDGVLAPHIDGIDLEVALTATRRSARIAAVELPAGLYWGDNPVRVTYYRYGSRDLESLDATLTIPAGTPLQGAISVAPAA